MHMIGYVHALLAIGDGYRAACLVRSIRFVCTRRSRSRPGQGPAACYRGRAPGHHITRRSLRRYKRERILDSV